MNSKSRIAASTAAASALLLTFGLTYPDWSPDSPMQDFEVQASTLEPALQSEQGQPQIAESGVKKTAQYSSFKVNGKQSIAELKSRFGTEGYLTILKINRIDPANLRTGNSFRLTPVLRQSLLTR